MSTALRAVIGDKLVDQEMKAVDFEDRIQSMGLIAIYFSAHWCPPCRGFTPQLKKAHQKWKADGQNIEVIFASSDQDEAAMASYLREDHGNWLAFPFGDSKINELSTKYSVRGIPTLVVLDADGKTIDASARATVTKKGDEAIIQWMGARTEGEPEAKEGPSEPNDGNTQESWFARCTLL